MRLVKGQCLWPPGLSRSRIFLVTFGIVIELLMILYAQWGRVSSYHLVAAKK